jgi:hypothetical protein
MKIIYIILIIIFLFSVSYAQKPNSHHHICPTTLILEVKPDNETAFSNQAINISFTISNLEICDASGIQINAKLKHPIQTPNKIIKITNNNKVDQDNNGNILSSNFDNDKKNKGDLVDIDKEGNIKIVIGSLRGKNRIIINYNTSIEENPASGYNDKVCYPIEFSDFQWVNRLTWNKPIIRNITIHKELKKNELAFAIEPQYNITKIDGLNYTIFEGTTLTLKTKDNNIIIKDTVIGNPNDLLIRDNHFEINRSGDHEISAYIDTPQHTIQMKNDSRIQVIKLIDHHKERIWDYDLYLFFVIPSFFIPLLIIELLRWRKKCMKKASLIFLLALVVLAYSAYIYNYYSSDAYYQDLIKLESISLSVAFLFLIYYYGCSDLKLKWNIFLTQIISMLIFYIFFHYYLPELLSNKDTYIFLSGLGPLMATTIYIKRPEICQAIIKKLDCKEDDTIRLVAIILVTIYIISISIFAGTGLGVSFSTQFKFFELIIIILSELMPLIAIAISGMTPKMAKNVIDVSLKGPNNNDE